MAVLKTSLAYFAIVFGFGFAFGTIRAVWVTPLLGASAAVLLELPCMLIISWFACQKLLSRWPSFPASAERAAIGLTALGLLLLAEFGLATLLFGQEIAAYLVALHDAPGLLGLAGQILFGLIPLVQRRA